MLKRPWEIIVLTVLYLMAPIANVAATGWVRGLQISDWYWLLLALGPADYFNLAIWWILAVAVWSVSRTGWWIFVALNILQLTTNGWQTLSLPGAGWFWAIGADFANVAIASLLFTRHARSPYFSPRLRWWNAEVRYRVVFVLEVPLLVRQNELEGRGLLLDLSVSGCFAELPSGLKMDQPVDLEFECWGLTIRSQGRILRRPPSPQALQGYGIQFQELNSDQKHHLKSLIATLRAHHVPSRNDVVLESRESELTLGPNRVSWAKTGPTLPEDSLLKTSPKEDRL